MHIWFFFLPLQRTDTFASYYNHEVSGTVCQTVPGTILS